MIEDKIFCIFDEEFNAYIFIFINIPFLMFLNYAWKYIYL
jgi:hypothetical protein